MTRTALARIEAEADSEPESEPSHPDVLWDADRVYFTSGDGVTAQDARTGKVLWHAPGPQARLCLSGDLLLAADWGQSPRTANLGRRVVARAATTGAEVFTVRLPQDDSFGPYPIEEMAGLFLVQTGEHPGGEGTGLLFDLKGKVRHRFDHQVITGRLVGTDRVFLTSHEAVCCDASDKVLWTLAFRSPEWIASGGLVTLETGDLLAFLYGRISDSGVQVIRLNPKTGKQVWQTQCAGLGVPHSKYHHWANVRVDGDRMKVTSRASGGTFVEYLDLASGRQLKRMAPARDRDW